MFSVVRSLVKGLIFGNALGACMYLGLLGEGWDYLAYTVVLLALYVGLWAVDVVH